MKKPPRSGAAALFFFGWEAGPDGPDKCKEAKGSVKLSATDGSLRESAKQETDC